MAIKRFFATKDNTITNAFKEGLTTRGTGSNMGAADILEVFSIYGQASSTSSELARTLVEFDTTAVTTARSASAIPASGSVDFYLRMYDAEHVESTPRDFTLTVAAISQSWNEGTGLDMNNYTDLGESNWIKASSTTNWADEGGKFLTGSIDGDPDMHTSRSFDVGTEDLSIEVTTIVEQWLKGVTGSYGFGVFLTSSQEEATQSYYTKKFFARSSEYFHRRPVLEARWNDSIADDSSNFYLSSSRAPAGPTGSALNLPIGGNVASDGDTSAVGGYVSTGIYSASLAYSSSSITSVYPVWHNGSGTEYFSGSAITVKSQEDASIYPIKDWVVNITNLKTTYSTDEIARFRLYVRPKNWNPNLYTVAQTQIETTPIEKAYYKLNRVVDNFEVISYGTGSGNESYTQLSYDGSGNYFDLDMSMLQSGYSYQLTFLFNLVGEYSEQRAKFKFRVSDVD
jgi:hypothetical protein